MFTDTSKKDIASYINPTDLTVDHISYAIRNNTPEGIYDYMYRNASFYHDTQPYMLGKEQYIRPFQTLLTNMQTFYQGCGTCLDWSLLLCSIMERQGLYPILILLGNDQLSHAVAGCCKGHIHTGVSYRDNAEEIRYLIAKDVIEIFETISLCVNYNTKNSSGKQDYSHAKFAANQTLQKAKILQMYDVGAARDEGIKPWQVLNPVSKFKYDDELESVFYEIERYISEIKLKKYISILLLYGLLKKSQIAKSIFGSSGEKLLNRIQDWLIDYARTNALTPDQKPQMTESYETIILLASYYTMKNKKDNTISCQELLISILKNMEIENYTQHGINIIEELDMDRIKSFMYRHLRSSIPTTMTF